MSGNIRVPVNYNCKDVQIQLPNGEQVTPQIVSESSGVGVEEIRALACSADQDVIGFRDVQQPDRSNNYLYSFGQPYERDAENNLLLKPGWKALRNKIATFGEMQSYLQGRLIDSATLCDVCPDGEGFATTLSKDLPKLQQQVETIAAIEDYAKAHSKK